jgi:iron-sulfur cluster insertion protein
MIKITEAAVNEITQGLAENNEPYLRISVSGGGCSGFQYKFDFEQTKNEDDFEVGQVLVDSMSMMYLNEAEVDYVDDLMGSQFVIKNPNAQTTCGCGSSFSV